MRVKYRLKVIRKESGDGYVPQVKRDGLFARWKTLMPERMNPEIVDVHIDPYDVFHYTKETALKIIEVYKHEQKQKEIIKVDYINLTSTIL